MKKSLIVTLMLITGLALVFTSCGGGGTNTENDNGGFVTAAPTSAAQTTQPTTTVASIPKPAGLETELYNNEEYKFSIEIPVGWTLQEEESGNYIVFRWISPSGEPVPNLTLTIRIYIQTILMNTFIGKYETEICGEGYTVTGAEEIDYNWILNSFTDSVGNDDGSVTEVMGETIYHQYGNRFYVTNFQVSQEGGEEVMAQLQYCVSTYDYKKKTG